MSRKYGENNDGNNDVRKAVEMLRLLNAKRRANNEPEFGKTYALTSKKGIPSIMHGNTWAESEVKNDGIVNPNCDKCKNYSHDGGCGCPCHE